MASRVCCALLLSILLAAAMSPGGAVPVDRHYQEFGQTEQEEQSASEIPQERGQPAVERIQAWGKSKMEKPQEWVPSEKKMTHEWGQPITEKIQEWIPPEQKPQEERVPSEMKMTQEWGQPITERILEWWESKLEKPQEERVPYEMKMTQEWGQPITERIQEWIPPEQKPQEERVPYEMKMIQEWGQPVTEKIQDWGEYKVEKPQEWLPLGAKEPQEGEQPETDMVMEWRMFLERRPQEETPQEEIPSEFMKLLEGGQSVIEEPQWVKLKAEEPSEGVELDAVEEDVQLQTYKPQEEGMPKLQRLQEGEEPEDLADDCCMIPDDSKGSEVFNIVMDTDRDNSDIVEDLPGQLEETPSRDKENIIFQEESGNSYFGTYLVTSIILVAVLYIACHNKRFSQQKIFVVALQGSRPNSWEYQKLEEKISLSAPLLNAHECQLSEKPGNGLIQP